MLVLRRSISPGPVETLRPGEAGNAADEDLNQVAAAGRLGADVEQGIEDLGQARVDDVIAEALDVVLGLTGVELILVLGADDDLVDQRLAQARDLHQGPEVTAPILVG